VESRLKHGKQVHQASLVVSVQHRDVGETMIERITKCRLVRAAEAIVAAVPGDGNGHGCDFRHDGQRGLNGFIPALIVEYQRFIKGADRYVVQFSKNAHDLRSAIVSRNEEEDLIGSSFAVRFQFSYLISYLQPKASPIDDHAFQFDQAVEATWA